MFPSLHAIISSVETDCHPFHVSPRRLVGFEGLGFPAFGMIMFWTFSSDTTCTCQQMTQVVVQQVFSVTLPFLVY